MIAGLRKVRRIGRRLGLLMVLSAISAAPGNAVETVAPVNAGRIVAIGGSITEIIYALGEEKRLIARDTTSVYPSQATMLPDVGYMRALSPEGVLSVNPDAIVALEGSGPQETISVLRATGVPFIEVPENYSPSGIAEKIRRVGAFLGVEAKASRLAHKVAADLLEAERSATTVGTRKRILFILSMRDGKILAAGRDTAAHGIIQMLGARNVLDGFAGYKQASNEAIIAAQPDVVLMMDRSGDHSATNAQLFSHPAIASTTAGEKRNVIRMDGLLLLGFGPRTAEAIRDLSAQLARLP